VFVMSDVCHTNATPAKNAAFPLTPALSPGERESRIQFLDKPEHLGLANRLTKVLPLPKGAGRGEGKRRFRRACSVAFARPPCEGRSICVLLRLVRERIIWFSSLFVCFTTAAFAAEPTVDPKDLPRIPPTAPDKALSTFRIKSGFRLELVAAEPLVVDPIAMSFDENGRLFVVEMRDYSERRDDRLGRIRMLEDTDGD